MEKHHHHEILDAMRRPDFYPHAAAAIELRQTHISTVFLTGPYVYKVKKPVNLGFLDFSTLASRRHYCEQELILNRRLSHGVYLEVLPITLDGNGYTLDGTGQVVEYAVKMRQLSDQDAMVRHLKQGCLDDGQMDRLVRILADFYLKTAIITEMPSGIRPVTENFEALEPFVGVFIDQEPFDKIRTSALNFYEDRQKLFQRRVTQGKIRDGHGDLRTDHIYLTPDGIQIIDCIEFNETLRHQDIISDLAFLAVDLEENHALPMVRRLMGGYVQHSGDLNAVPLLDFYRCYRSMVRCKVSCLRLQQLDPYTLAYKKLIAGAEKYLAMAHAYATAFSRPIMWIICGLPASGKSTIAAEMAEIYGFRLLRSDLIRKEMFDSGLDAGGPAAFERGIYTTQATATTYDHMLSTAAECIEKDNGVVLDATFSGAAWRAAALDTAEHAGAIPVFIECRASRPVLSARLKQRDTEPSLSDARMEHLDDLLKRYEPFTGAAYDHRRIVNTELPLKACLSAILLDNDPPSADGRKGGHHV